MKTILVGSVAVLALAANAVAGVSYGVVGSTYEENFNGLPTAPAPGGTSGTTLSNNTIMAGAGAGYTTGWVNDNDYAASADARDMGVKGWYLYHGVFSTSYLTTSGPSRHAMYIQGGGSTAGTGGFWGFNSGTSTTDAAYGEKALGSVPTSVGAGAFANAANPMRMALEVVNNTSETLSSFTLTYDGEQYVDGRSATAGVLSFFYSLGGDTAAHWNLDRNGGTYSADDLWGSRGTYGYVGVPALNFAAPANTYSSGTTPAAQLRDGNLAENRTANITATIDGVSWAPGASLWLMWENGFIASGQSDGLAIDNVRFSAVVPEPAGVAVVGVAGMGLMGRRRRAV